MTTSKAKGKKSVLSIPVMRLKVTLLRVSPPIWRRILAPASMRLSDFHYLLQDAIGWTNSHLHQFDLGGLRFGDVTMDEESDVEDERRLTLAKALPKVGSKMVYEYDFGDGWRHEVRLEEVVPRAPEMAVPSCLDGGRACPPEDCGGSYGYGDLLKALADPSHEDHARLKDWLGGGFDPEAFDLAGVNEAIKTDRTRKLTEQAMREMDMI